MSVEVRRVRADDRHAWEILFQSYCDFGNADQTPEMRERVWTWIHDRHAQTECFVVENKQRELVGFVHFRSYERPMHATIGAHIDDMFVAPNMRGRGIVDLLITHVGAYAKEQGWDVVRWMTSDTNYRARAVYDRHATKSDWLTYQLNA